jgi:hypothetical protein
MVEADIAYLEPSKGEVYHFRNHGVGCLLCACARSLQVYGQLESVRFDEKSTLQRRRDGDGRLKKLARSRSLKQFVA